MSHKKNECYMDKVKAEENKDIGFDLSLLKRTELNVNLIHFDLNITNSENYKYYSDFKVDVVGGYLAMDNLIMFIKYLDVIKNKNIPFIIITSGSSGKDICEICKHYPFVKEVIIFCGNYKYNEHYLHEYPGLVKKVFTDIRAIYNYIKSFGPNQYREGIINFRNSDQFMFSYDDIKMDKQFEQCPVISAYEYDKCYFLIHKAYAHFFGDIDKKDEKVTFTKKNFNIIQEYINNSQIISNVNREELMKRFLKLRDANNFVELAIRTYTEESCFCYIFNRTMRNFDPGLISLAYYMGPFLYGLNKYVKENPQNFGFNSDMTLYRNIQCSIYDFYLYKLNLNHIICFPSITSTSADEAKVKPTKNAKKINKNGLNPDDMINLTMIFNYKHKPKNISPGIVIKNNKGSDGNFLSKHPNENEVILFPFTFARIIKISSTNLNSYIINFDIINRDEYIEYTLRDFPEKRPLFYKID